MGSEMCIRDSFICRTEKDTLLIRIEFEQQNKTDDKIKSIHKDRTVIYQKRDQFAHVPNLTNYYYYESPTVRKGYFLPDKRRLAYI